MAPMSKTGTKGNCPICGSNLVSYVGAFVRTTFNSANIEYGLECTQCNFEFEEHFRVEPGNDPSSFSLIFIRQHIDLQPS